MMTFPESVVQWVADRFPEGGFFVEAGAHDGIGDSQTYFLEQLGPQWDGICVEPSSRFGSLRTWRRCRVDSRALWSTSGESVVFRELLHDVELSGILEGFKHDGWDRITRQHHDRPVQTVTLTDLLVHHQAPAEVTFLSLDTEGSEVEIMAAHDFDRFRFRVLLVEHNSVESEQSRMVDLLAKHGYERLATSSINDLYERRAS